MVKKAIKETKKLLDRMIRWYMQHDLRMTVSQLTEYRQGKPFSWFPEEMTTIRCEGYKDYLNKQLVDDAKLKRNSFYGNMIEDLGLQKSTELARDK